MGVVFGRRLRELRVERDLTMRELGDELGWSAAYVCEIEMGRRNPPKEEVIEKIGEIFNIATDELLDLARKDRKKVIIRVESKPDWMHNVAHSMARTIDENDLDEEQANQIIRILDRKGK